MISRKHMVFGVALSVLMAGCVTTPAGSPTIDSGAVVVESEDLRAAVIFGYGDRSRIRHYYKSKHKAKKLPPGLAKKHKSHPGLRKHIEKYGNLPSDIKGSRIPVDLERTLRHLPEDYVRIRVGGDLLLMNKKTRYVFDVVFDVD